MSTAIETRAVGDFGTLSPGTVPYPFVTNRISTAAVSISVLSPSLFFLLMFNMYSVIYSWVISPIYLMVLNNVPCNIPVQNVTGVPLCFTGISAYFRFKPH